MTTHKLIASSLGLVGSTSNSFNVDPAVNPGIDPDEPIIGSPGALGGTWQLAHDTKMLSHQEMLDNGFSAWGRPNLIRFADEPKFSAGGDSSSLFYKYPLNHPSGTSPTNCAWLPPGGGGSLEIYFVFEFLIPVGFVNELSGIKLFLLGSTGNPSAPLIMKLTNSGNPIPAPGQPNSPTRGLALQLAYQGIQGQAGIVQGNYNINVGGVVRGTRYYCKLKMAMNAIGSYNGLQQFWKGTAPGNEVRNVNRSDMAYRGPDSIYNKTNSAKFRHLPNFAPVYGGNMNPANPVESETQYGYMRALRTV